jgi:serine/threonine-protein kinase
MSAPEDLKQLGRYDLTRVLGKGAMGIVYEGLDPKLHRKVAIKTILKGHMDDDDASKEYSMRFMREAQAVARLNHPHIVQVYDFGEEQEVAYIVMEFIKGKELKNFFDAAERFELKEAVRIMCELLDALEFAHEGGIVHRDIKPANVMLDSQARVKLADFGVARVTDDRSAAEKTQAGTMVGTPAYMSPEQITGGNIDRRTDVFSAGIILYQFLTGEKPFTGSGAWTIAKKIIQDHPPVPSSINNTISPLFDAVVNKALAKSVEQRYQSAKEFGAALKSALEGKSDEDESDKTVVGSMADIGNIAKPSAQMAGQKPESTKGTSATGSQEVELEFWRAIKDGNDPDDFELYVQQFPNGIYAALAKRKIAKLRGVAPEDTGAKAKEQEKKEAEEAAKREAEVKQKLAEEKAKLEAQLAAKEEEYKKREAEAAARQAAEAKARAEADAKREAEAKTRAAAEEKARLEAIEKAKKEAQAELAKREAEYQKREADARAKAETEEKARLEAIEKAKKEAQAELAKREAEYQKREADARAKAEAEAKARRDLEEKAKKDAEIRTRAEAEARAKRELEEKARREADAKARAEADARAKKEAEERAKKDAEAAKREAELKKKLAEAPRAKLPVAPIIAAIIAVAGVSGGAYWYFTKEKREAEAAALATLQEAASASKELQAAQAKQLESLKALEQARAAEEAARKSGDAAALKKAQEDARRAEEEAKKQADVVKQRTAAADEAKKKADDAKKKADQAQASPTKQESPAAPKPEVAAVTPKADAPKQDVAAKTDTSPKADTPAKSDTKAPRVLSRSEREAQHDAEVAAKALGKPVEQVASLSPAVAATAATAAPGAAAAGTAPTAPVAKGAASASDADALYQKAQSMEASDPSGAIRIYRRAARDGSGKAAKRLGELFDKGAPGVTRDYQESLSWYSKARELGETVELSGKR